MPQLDSDAFTYSNGALATVSSGKWTNLSGPPQTVQVVSNAVGASAGDAEVVITTWSGSTTDHYSQIVITTPLGDFGGLTVRSDAVHTYYALQFQTAASTSEVYKVVAGVSTLLSSTAITWANGDTAYLEVQGTTLISKQNGTTRHNFTDSAIASGKPGIGTYSNATTYDNWAAGDFGGGALTLPWQPRHTNLSGPTGAIMLPGGMTPPSTVS